MGLRKAVCTTVPNRSLSVSRLDVTHPWGNRDRNKGSVEMSLDSADRCALMECYLLQPATRG